MKKFIKHFRREEAGIWICVEPATLDLPQGRIQVSSGTRFTLGTMFMNVEVAKMLDDEYERQQALRFPPRA
jgi:hypothetical protein